MDIEYLLFLQNFREATNNVLSPLMEWVTKFSVSFFPIALMLVIYWALDRRAGRTLIAGLGAGLFMNGFLKLTFCVYRPWIRDARVLPYGDSKTAATGYSFPSGHSTRATAIFGGIGAWQRKRHIAITIVCFVLVALVMFSRNYLGVHTPQDVLVGCLATALVMYLTARLECWSDAAPKRDYYILAAGIVLCAAAAVYYAVKPYPLTLLADGSLLVDPKKMRADSFEGIGFVLAYVVCRCVARRKLPFDTALDRKHRLPLALAALLPVYLWVTKCTPLLLAANRSLGKFLYYSVIVSYSMLVVPGVFCLIGRCKKSSPTANRL